MSKILEKLNIKPPISGYKRRWCKCNECGEIFYVDFVPYSLSNPIRWLPCYHGLGGHWNSIQTTVTEKEAIKFLKKKYKKKKVK